MSLRLIQRIVAHHYGLTREEMISPCRIRKLAHPRMVAMTLCRELTNASTTRIGKAFGRDHTTIISATRRCARKSELVDVLATLRPIVQTALALEELDTLPLRVYTAQVQQSRWPEPIATERSRDHKHEYQRKLELRALEIGRQRRAFRTDQPVPSALYR